MNNKTKMLLLVFAAFVAVFFIVYKFANLKKVIFSARGNFSAQQKMEIKKKWASLFFVNLHGKKMGKSTKRFLASYQPGGIIIMSNNVYTADMLKQFITEIRSQYSTGSADPLSPIIGIDQEGGRVRRIREGIPQFPSARECAARGENYVTEMAKINSIELKKLGINLNFAPVADVLKNTENTVIGDRAYGNTPEAVIKMVRAYLKGAASSGLLSCVKHYPGHGSVSADSHNELPVDNSSEADLILSPFIEAVKNNVPFIMSAHILFPRIDSVPATLSSKILSIIRNQYGFNGVMISDDLSMGAIKKNYKTPEAVIQSLKAGMDMFIHTAVRYKDHIQLIDKSFQLLLKDTTALIALERAYQRVQEMKKRVKTFY